MISSAGGAARRSPCGCCISVVALALASGGLSVALGFILISLCASSSMQRHGLTILFMGNAACTGRIFSGAESGGSIEPSDESTLKPRRLTNQWARRCSNPHHDANTTSTGMKMTVVVVRVCHTTDVHFCQPSNSDSVQHFVLSIVVWSVLAVIMFSTPCEGYALPDVFVIKPG